MRLKALILENVLHTHMMGVKSLENFLETLEGQVLHVWGSGRQNPEKFGSQKISKKKFFEGQNDSKKNFFLNFPEVSGT